MTTNFIQAAEDARRLLRGFQAFAEVAAALDAANTAVQAKSEAEAALASLQEPLATARAELAAANDATSEAKFIVQRMLDAATERANEIKQAALAEANEMNAKMKERETESAAALASTAEAATKMVADAEAERDQVLADLAKAQSDLTTIRAAIAAIKEA